ncbi:MAG: OmpA family protein [Actinobacteria bacterium]|nr:OmpA family protein [Actinomycetota bacterium]
MTRIAVIDWSRRTFGAQREDVSETEALANTTAHNRSIGEVTSAVARESQQGRSATSATSASVEAGAAGVGLLPGPGLVAGSVGMASTASVGMGWSSSSGFRSIGASMSQDIRDSTQQAANAARNRRATVVKEVSQSESEQLSTRVLVNYNHMHALTIQYYEVVQLYRVAVRLEAAERCLFIPVRLIDFHDPVTVQRFRHVIAAAALDGQVRTVMQDRPDSVAVRAPALNDEAPPWSPAAAADLSRTLSHPVGPRPAHTVHLPADATLRPEDITVVPAHSTHQRLWCRAFSRSGVRYAWQPGYADEAPQSWPVKGNRPEPLLLNDLRELEFMLWGDEDDSSGDMQRVTVEIRFQTGGRTAALPLTVDVPVNYGTVRLQFRGGTASTAEVSAHLNAHRLHYSQAVWRSLDSVQLASVLAPYRLGGRPVTEIIDPMPAAIAGNYLIFRMHTDPSEDSGWASWLDEHGVSVGRVDQDLVPLPSGGVFAEAVLGRANSAEKLDITRFWNWQDSPIPVQAPEIAPLQAGSRATPENLQASPFSAPLVNIVAPTSLPDPQGLAATLAAVANGSMFRDMSGLAAVAQLTDAALKASSAGAGHAAEQATENLKVGADVLKAALAAAATYATGVPVSPGPSLSSASPSKVGALMNQGAKLDAKARSDGDGGVSIANGHGGSSTGGRMVGGAGGSGSGGGSPDDWAPWPVGSSSGSYESDAFVSAIGSTTDARPPSSGTGTAERAPTVERPQLPQEDVDELRFSRDVPYGLQGQMPRIDTDAAPDGATAWLDWTLWNFAIGGTEIVPRFDDVLGLNYAFPSSMSSWRERGYDVKVVGVASFSGDPSYNQALSQQRAENSKKLLVERFGFHPAKVEVVGGGQRGSAPPDDVFHKQQMRDNPMGAWRAWNRRVEFRAVPRAWKAEHWREVRAHITDNEPNEARRDTLERLIYKLADAGVDDGFVSSYQALLHDMRWYFRTSPMTPEEQAVKGWFYRPSRWGRFSFFSRMRESVAAHAQPDAAMERKVDAVHAVLNAMRAVPEKIQRERESREGRLVKPMQAINDWIVEQRNNPGSVYSVDNQ